MKFVTETNDMLLKLELRCPKLSHIALTCTSMNMNNETCGNSGTL